MPNEKDDSLRDSTGLPLLASQPTSGVYLNDQMEIVSWDAVVRGQRNIAALLGVRIVSAIVATQDCDALRAADITLCEIRPFREVERKSKETKADKSWADIITQQSKKNLKWFYLPPDGRIGFADRMGADFQATLRLVGDDLRQHRHLRRGRLNPEADEHFRERSAEFFRRYPYDEWYPLNRDEFNEYQKAYPDAEPRDWQRMAGPAQDPTFTGPGESTNG